MKKYDFFTLAETHEMAHEILCSDHFSKFFSMKQLRDKMISKKFDIPERYLFSESEFSPLQRHVSKQLNHVFRKFQKQNLICKHSNRFWIILKDNFKEEVKDGEKQVE